MYIIGSCVTYVLLCAILEVTNITCNDVIQGVMVGGMHIVVKQLIEGS